MKIRKHVRFFGRVQGVYFRANTKRKADELGVSGWVRNEDDGSVEAVFEAESQIIDKIIDWCSTSIRLADVTDSKTEEYAGSEKFHGFEIKD